VTHACNPNYSGGRNQEDCSSKPVWANSSQDPISKRPITKKRLVEWLKVEALSSSPSTAKKKKKRKKKRVFGKSHAQCHVCDSSIWRLKLEDCEF
jgi:hypothetical protein